MIDQDAYYQRVRDAAKPEHFDLAEHMPESLAEPVLGRVKPEPRLHTPALNLADYIEAQADPPAAVHRSHLNFPWGMLMNDSLGDCFPAGTLVRMADGTSRPIEAMGVLDRIVTAEGRESLVRAVMARWHAEPIVRVIAWGHRHLRMTAEHPVLTRRGYVPAAQLTSDDWIALPHWQPEPIAAIEPMHYMLHEDERRLKRNGGTRSARTAVQERVGQLPDQIPLTAEFGELLGLFFAEGSSNQNLIRFTFGIHERETLVARCTTLIEELLGAIPQVRSRPNNSVDVTVCGKQWRLLFEALCSKGAAGKHMHADLWGGGEAFLAAILAGWMAGDGSTQHGVHTTGTASRMLAQDMFNLAQQLNYEPIIRCDIPKPSIDRSHSFNGPDPRPRWSVAVAEAKPRAAERSSRFRGVSRTRDRTWGAWGTVDGRSVNLGTYTDEERAAEVAADFRLKRGYLGNGRKITEDGVTWRRVRSTEIEPFAGPVFNLSVEGDESYVAEGVGVHNCGDAMALHGIEAFHLDAGTPVPPFRDQDAEALYEEVSGYVPGDPSTDNGTDNRQLFTYWEDPGITCHADGSNHRIAASLFFDPKDERTAKIGMWEFVVAFWAVGLPLTAQRQAIWDVTDPALGGDAAVGSWGFHDVCRLSFSAAGVRFISWGQGMLETWEFDRAYGVQGIVVVSLEQLSLKGISPSGVNWDRLGSDLRKLPSVPAS